jgi:lipopolysaccharide exporter
MAGEPGPRGSSAVGGFLWTTLAWGGNRVVIFVLTLVLARLLTPEDFGLVTAALTLIAMLDAALDLGVGAAVVAEQERGISRRTRTAGTLNLIMSAVVAGVGIAASPLIASLFGAPDQARLFAVIFIYPLFRGAGQVSDAVLKRDLLFKRRTLVDLLRAAVRVAVSIPLALTVGGAISIAAGIVVSELAALVLLMVLEPVRPVLRMDRATVHSLLGFGGQVTAIRILGSVRSNVDYLVVGGVLGASALGIYGMAYKLPEMGIENVLWIFSGVALAAYSRAYAKGRDALITTMLKATRLLALYGLAAATTLAVLARDAVPVLFSEQWDAAVTPMMLISLSLGLMSIAWASGDVFVAMGRLRLMIVLDVPATAAMVVAFLLVAHIGLVAVAAVHLAFNAVYCVARLILLQRVTGVRGRDLADTVMPALAVAGVTAAVGLAVRSVLPPGELLSLIVLTGVCGLAVAASSLLLARTAVREGLRAVLPSSRSRR